MNNFLTVFALLLCVAGFHGIFFYGDPAKKIAAWVFLQAGLLLFLFQAVPPGIPLRPVLAVEILGVTLAVAGSLALLAHKKGRLYGTRKAGGAAKRQSP